MKTILLALWDKFLDADLYMTFHWCVLIGLWIAAFYQLFRYELGDVLCISAIICAWKLKGVEE